MEPKNEMQLIDEVGKWATNNFGEKRNAELGIVEEIGEACHAKLKFLQGIRGYDKAKYEGDFTDALADTIIYLADWCSLRGAWFNFKRNEIKAIPTEDERRIICHIMQCGSAFFNYPMVTSPIQVTAGESETYSLMAQRLCTAIEYWAVYNGYQLDMLVSVTWAKVKLRNWADNANSAHICGIHQPGSLTVMCQEPIGHAGFHSWEKE